MIVINWYAVIINSFWIFGLALLLAAFSYHYWAAQQNQRRLNEQLALPAFTQMYWISIFLITIGLAGTSQQTWEAILWIAFSIWSLYNYYKTR